MDVGMVRKKLWTFGPGRIGTPGYRDRRSIGEAGTMQYMNFAREVPRHWEAKTRVEKLEEL